MAASSDALKLDDTQASPSSVRYHGLDALRAWAMSMGIVLHAAWFMIPEDAGAPMTDASASGVTDFICLGIHTFRMQLFFVLAGLFACLLLRKRGFKSFAVNRVKRIVIPLVVFWVILCPIMVWQYRAGGILSGAIQGDKTAWQLTEEFLRSVSPTNLVLVHLWFLYYLCLAYVIVLAARAILTRVDSESKMRDWISDRAGDVLCSRWSVLILAAIFAPFMIPMKGVWGIEIVFNSLIAEWPGVATYTSFFVVGWLIYRNIDKLATITRGWRWQLCVGLIMIVPYFYYSKQLVRNGYVTWFYPALCVEDFHYVDDQPDYPAFREKLLSSPADSVAGALWSQIPEAHRTYVMEKETMTQNQFNGLLVAINTKVMGEAKLAEQVNVRDISLSQEAASIAAMPSAKRIVAQNQLLNRELLNQGFEGVLYSDAVNRPHYWLIHCVYIYYYSVITWLLIFGCIGFSQQFFDSESRFWRYFSDSSYWFYLAHLPIQFQLLLWVGDAPWHWAVKFSFYIISTIAVLLPSYHFLVRPTWLGLMLNGRMASVWPKPSTTPDSDSDSGPDLRTELASNQRVDPDSVSGSESDSALSG